ncbi:ribbon-helix-helix domain-containing protein [Anabaena sp. CCY 0017]|uniref:ribbon-helix-helix domain-containing protein n=1 Tax=Anabaena sp. CCY 0017 TaxID=3103866 RepID=UPI0039C61BA3
MNKTFFIEMTKRTTIVLPDVVYEDLQIWADEEGRATANLVAFLVEQAVRAKFPSKYPPGYRRLEASDRQT